MQEDIMPKIGLRVSRSENRSIRVAKRLAVALFVSTVLFISLDRLWLMTGSLSTTSGAQARSRNIQRISNSDCTFLREPENFRGVQARHRLEVSRRTEAVSSALEQQPSSAVPAQDIPRRTFIDILVFDRMARDGIPSAPVISDLHFMRRVTLDLTGRIPSPDEINNFMSSQDPNKRDVLVDSLLGSPEFIDKWTSFFADLLKITSNSTSINRYIGGREAFYSYVRDSIAQHKSYAQMAAEMITANGDSYVDGPVNFIVGGNVPMGPVQDTYDGLAVRTSTDFLGLSPMDCLLCHDGAGHLDQINLWGSKVTRAQAWGMSAFFARAQRRTVNIAPNVNKYTVQENANGEYLLNTNSGNRQTRAPINGVNTVAPAYLFGGGLNPGENRRQALARLITADKQFGRAAVNYIWEELMVEPLVSPSNSFDPARIEPGAQLPEGWAPQPANPDLLEALTQEFIANNFNIRHIISYIAKSNAYQLSSVYPEMWKVEYVPYYARKFVRRLDAEEIHDAIVKATGMLPVTTYRDTGGQNQTVLGYPIINEQGQKLREVTWAMQLPEPAEPRQRGDVGTFLNSFLRGNRDTNLRQQDSSILQSLNLMNNNFVMSRIHNANRVIIPNTLEIPSTVRRLLADATLNNEGIITQLYLHTLSRYPSDEEKAKLLNYYSSMGRQAATESLQWALLNKADFIFNY
jgi:Protein of unknown function (DUF1549)/Protein of unknown function (DUF1553)